jgi:hypothetical protein
LTGWFWLPLDVELAEPAANAHAATTTTTRARLPTLMVGEYTAAGRSPHRRIVRRVLSIFANLIVCRCKSVRCSTASGTLGMGP